MPIQYPEILQTTAEVMFDWEVRDTLLYGLGIGLGEDPLDVDGLALVTEPVRAVMPTLAAVWAARAEPSGFAMIDYSKLLHAEQHVVIHHPLPASGRIAVQARFVSVQDRGPDRGAMLTTEMRISDQTTGAHIATAQASALARADGGFGGPAEAARSFHSVPERAPDKTIVLKTRPNQALLYRLSGDFNPLHSDPAVALAAGFDRPILHGLCTYALTARAVTDIYCDRDPGRIRSHRARFSAPVYPGEDIRVKTWRDGDDISFTADVPNRGVEIIKGGHSRILA